MTEPNFDSYERPIQQISLSDWQAQQRELHESANKKQSESFDLRFHGRGLISETDIRTEWNNHINNHKLAERISEIAHWHHLFELVFDRIKIEIQLLAEEKSDTEKELELLDYPLQITVRCIAKRDSRLPSEITYDDGDIELQKEMDTIEEMKKLMIHDIKIIWDKLNRLEDVKMKVTNEIKDKEEAMKIDSENLHLDRSYPYFTYKPHAQNISDNHVSHDNWLEHSRNLKSMAENELSDTYALRELVRADKEKSKHNIEFQRDKTNYALRRRAFASQKACNELEWQKMKVQKEMESLDKSLSELENALRAKTDDLKCVETRLENRNYRPGFELCLDDPEYGLKDEMTKIQETKNEIAEKIEQAKCTYKDLQGLLTHINENLENKRHSLTTDVMCLDMRSTLGTRDEKRAQNMTDRNIILNNLSKELPVEAKKALTISAI